nr:DNA-directed DNA polymerase [Tanacetum cinerariifolium]
MLRACPHYGFTELTQIDTFYNVLDDNDQDSLNSTAGGNLLSKNTREALQIIENKSKVRYSRKKPNVSRMNTTSRENASKTDDRIDKLAGQILTLVDIFAKKVVTPALVKAVEESCVTYGGNRAYYNCPITDSNQPSVCVATGTYNQVALQNRASNYMAPPGFAPVQNNSQNRHNQGQGNNFNRGNNFHELADRSITRPKGVAEDVFVKVGKFHFSIDFVVVDFEADPRVPLILGRYFLRTGCALIDVYGEEITLWVNDEAVTFNLNQTIEEYAQEMLGFSNNSLGDNPTSTFEPILFDSSPSLTPFEGGVDKLPVIISKDLKVDGKEALLKVLKSHKRAIAWKITDIKGIDPQFCTHKILMEEDYKLAVQSQRRWVSPIHCAPKKGGIIVVENKNNELIPTRLVTGWRVCIDYRKLNDATRKDHFPLPFMDQMLERLAGNEFYCFLDGFYGYFEIPINPPDQEKTTFTCPYRTFAYRRMPFGLCNAPGTFQRCMMAIFHDMIEKTMDVFMDDF